MSQSDFVTRGQALVASGQYQEAVKVCRLGLLGRPTTVEGRLVLGQALLALKRYDEVLAEMRVALELDHDSVVATALKAEALLEKGDPHAALEAVQPVATAHPGEPRLRDLVARARARATGRAALPPRDPYNETRHYPGPGGPAAGPAIDDDDSAHGIEDTGGETRQTSPAGARGRSPKVPPANVLAVGDRSGTVEVDPVAEGLEVDDDDFGALAAPPSARGAAKSPANAAAAAKAARARAQMSAAPAASGKSVKASAKEVTSVELADDELDELIEVESAVGPLPTAGAARARAAAPLAGMPSGQFPDVPSLGAQLPLPPGPVGPAPALVPPKASPVAKTIAIAPAAPTAGTTPPEGAPAWAKATIAAQPMPPSSVPPMESIGGIPGLIEALERPSMQAVPQNAFPASETSASRPMKTGLARKRSRARVFGWIVVGGLVVGGGVFAGFQIRAARLAKQIDAARARATDDAKHDTWRGWQGARDSLAGIAQAQATLENKAALARARGVLAFAFGDGAADAKVAADAVGDKDGGDGALAAAYVALEAGELKQAKLAVDRAAQLAPDDAGTWHARGELALATGDVKGAIEALDKAVAQDGRALYAVALARGHAQLEAWDAAAAALDKALAASKDHVGALIEQAFVIAASGAPADVARRAIDGVLAEAAKPPADQPRGVSPLEAALARVALARLELAQGEREAALKDTAAALALGVDDPRLAEEVCEALLAAGAPQVADATKLALQKYPEDRRVHLVVAEDLVAHGRAGEALDYLAGKGDRALALPRGLAVRGRARLATGDLDGARADFDAAFKLAPQLELAIVGRAEVLRARGEPGALDDAYAILSARVGKATPSPALAIAMARVLRARGTFAGRDQARELLDKAYTRAGGAAAGPSGPAAQLAIELATLAAESGAGKDARALLAPLVKAGDPDARLANALILLDDGDPTSARTELDALVRDAGAKPPVALALEAARLHALAGDHAGAAQLLDGAERTPGVVGWKLDRERARLFLRRGDVGKAGEVIARALATSGTDLETLELATDIAYADLQTDAAQGALVEQVKTIVQQRLVRELDAGPRAVLGGKLGLAQGLVDAASDAYKLAREAYAAHKSTRRRMAQVDFGFAVAAIDRNDLPAARDLLENVEVQDPTLYDAFLFHAHVARELKDTKKALELARTAARLDPDSIQAWYMVALGAQGATGQGKTFAEALARLNELAPGGPELAELRKK